MGYPTAGGGSYFYRVRGGQSSCSRVLLLPLGVPSRAGAGNAPHTGIAGEGGGVAIKRKGVCRWVRPGERKCASFEEGLLRLWIGGLVAHAGGLGVKRAGSKSCKRWAAWCFGGWGVGDPTQAFA